MSCMSDNLNEAELEKTLEFFKDMGFSEKYVEQLQRDLILAEPRYVRNILDNIK